MTLHLAPECPEQLPDVQLPECALELHVVAPKAIEEVALLVRITSSEPLLKQGA